MPLGFVLDEHLRGGALWHAIQLHNAGGGHFLDVVQVGDLPSPPRGTSDPDLMLWCEAQGRILISRDQRSMPGHARDHFRAGRRLPGLLLLRRGWKPTSVLAQLIHHDQTCGPDAFQDRVEYIA